MNINTIRLRKLIGWLGMLLPWIVALLIKEIPSSISATYYTFQAGPVFMIILGSASFLLGSYKGYDRIDDVINTVASIFGLCICLFPCEMPGYEFVGTFQLPVIISGYIHNSSAAVFFGCLSINSLFRFTKHGPEEMTKKKKIRNVIYIVCGIGMVGAFAMFALPNFEIKIWLIETVALFFFGLSWLTKANCYKFLFCD